MFQQVANPIGEPRASFFPQVIIGIFLIPDQFPLQGLNLCFLVSRQLYSHFQQGFNGSQFLGITQGTAYGVLLVNRHNPPLRNFLKKAFLQANKGMHLPNYICT